MNEKFDEKVYEKLRKNPAEELGYLDASKLIEKIVNGKIFLKTEKV